jgi:hypothetical protein
LESTNEAILGGRKLMLGTIDGTTVGSDVMDELGKMLGKADEILLGKTVVVDVGSVDGSTVGWRLGLVVGVSVLRVVETLG